MARPSARSWLPWLLGVLALGAALAYALSPGGVEITGMGTIEPVFEELVVPTNRWASAAPSRLAVAQRRLAPPVVG